MATYKTPGAYVEEISTLPGSIVSVQTAIPVFIGYTEKATKTTAGDLLMIPTRIKSMMEYETYFGTGHPQNFNVTIADTVSGITLTNRDVSVEKFDDNGFRLYYQVQMFFANGGGPCYILAVKNYFGSDTMMPDYDDFADVWAALEKEDEPTLIVLPDAPWDSGEVLYSSYGDLIKDALAHCNKMKDRFVIADVHADSYSTIGDDFRDNVGVMYLNYAAAYYPALVTNLSYNFDGEGVIIDHIENEAGAGSLDTLTLEAIDTAGGNDGLVKQIQSLIEKTPMILGPCGAIAGVYAATDRNRGVWKAPANVSLNRVLEPAVALSSEQQETLNVDSTSGKSINAIRTFSGKGTLVWGARTLAGNDNEWRYVSVRRLFIMIEESVQKATQSLVFEPNDAGTWNRAKGMIENYLNGLWRQGAMAGSKPAEAYFVNVGIGSTMTAQDILEGRLIIEVGIAAVRPAEFIILKFSHKLLEA